jgi:hypothetical protein
MKLKTITEDKNMLYYTVVESNADTLYTVPTEKCWLNTPDSVDAMSIYIQDFTIYAEMITTGRASLYQFVAPAPTPLPVNITLNYVKMQRAIRLSESDIAKYLEMFKRAEQHYNDSISNIIINTAYGDYTDDKHDDHIKHDKLVSILSNIVKSTGDIVYNPQDTNKIMKHQVIVSIPVNLERINLDSILNTDSRFDTTQLTANGSKIVGIIQPRRPT